MFGQLPKHQNEDSLWKKRLLRKEFSEELKELKKSKEAAKPKVEKPKAEEKLKLKQS